MTIATLNMDMEYMVNSSDNATATTEADFSPTLGDSNVTEYNATGMDANDSTGEDEEMLKIAFFIGDFVHQYYIPVVCCTGSIGNILSVFVFFRTKLRKLSSSFYLAALAVSDTCFLAGLFAQWLNFLNVDIYNRNYFCQFFTFSSYLASFCSVWFVVAFTVERFIAVIYPLKRQTMCTVRRAKIVLFCLTLVGCLHCLPYVVIAKPVFMARLNATICDLNTEYKEQLALFNYWDSIVVYAVPFTTIAVLNTCTGCTVWKFATVRRTLTMHKMKPQTNSMPSNSSNSSGGTSAVASYRISASLKRQKSTGTHPSGQHIVANRQPDDQEQQQQQSQQQHQINNCQHHCEITQKPARRKVQNSSQLKVTKMLLIVSTVFVCLNLPSCLLRIEAYWETDAARNENSTIALQYIFHAFFITNFGINFVLYCVSGQNFRKAVLSIFRRVSSAQREAGNTQVTVSEYCRNTGTSTRRRMMTQHCWNEMHELHPLK
ncbi:galanin-like G-protein coupled receptor npr-9 isoform X1 [Drosophila teissieri]|uniref:galanin-like G-protein coupled receptor npr-9 isoform X1 n=1 Tax=Drosophila teissieri TaxID=7243 RepID=UPI001CB9F8B6|nr:galanin-like G-protein coupled receptor npr-9 isoform X1 [Drosophila teissieri]